MILALFLAPAYGQLVAPSPGESGNANGGPLIQEQVPATPTGEGQEAEMNFPIMRTVGGLGLVLCLMIAAYFAARKFAPRYFTRGASDKNLRLIETLAMGDKRSISLIEVANSRFLIGNTPHQINLLAALPEPVSLVSEPDALPLKPNDTIREESHTHFRNLFEVEKRRSSQHMGHPLPEDIRTKMRQLREALER